MTYIICQNHDCRQTYPITQFNKNDRNVPCPTCKKGTLIGENGEVTLSGQPYVHKTINPKVLERIEERKRQEPANQLKLYYCVATRDNFEVAKHIVAKNKRLAIGEFKSLLTNATQFDHITAYEVEVDGYDIHFTKTEH